MHLSEKRVGIASDEDSEDKQFEFKHCHNGFYQLKWWVYDNKKAAAKLTHNNEKVIYEVADLV